MHVDTLIFTPLLEQAASLVIEHTRYHAVTGLDHGQLDSALDQRLENDTADKPGAD